VKLDKMPRMADFARIACAYAKYAGVGSEKMLDVIMSHTARQTQEVLDSDPVATAIRDFIQNRKSWTGTAAQLLVLLNDSAPTPKPDGWPKQANNLTRKINVLHATLNEVGISVRKHKLNGEKVLTLESSADLSNSSSPSTQGNAHAGYSGDDESKSSSGVSSQSTHEDGKSPPNKSSSPISTPLKPNAGAGWDDEVDKDDESGVLSGAAEETEVEL